MTDLDLSDDSSSSSSEPLQAAWDGLVSALDHLWLDLRLGLARLGLTLVRKFLL